MNQNLLEKIKTIFPEVKENINIASLTTFGVGGDIRFYLRVTSEAEFLAALRSAVKHRLPFLVMAGGSNIIFSDHRLEKLIIHYLAGRSQTDQIQTAGPIISCAAGVNLANLIKISIDRGLAGLETLSGIPGTVGGAIVGNAGAYGREIADAVKRVKIFDGRKIRWLAKANCRFGYRDSIFKHKPWFVLAAVLEFKTGRPTQLKKISRDIIKIRLKKYKPDMKCPGSFFKNILVKEVSAETLRRIDPAKIIDGKIPAGYLLETIGARGRRFGGIAIADFHGNLLINNNRGTYHEVRQLAHFLRQKVKNKFGIVLEEEIRYMV